MRLTPAAARAVITCAALIVTSSASAAPNINYVPINDAGNTAIFTPSGTFGAVPYNYQIGKTEITNAQYAAFLNSLIPSRTTPSDSSVH